MSENKESPDSETPWVDSSAGKKDDLAPNAQCEKEQSRSDCSLGGASYQRMGISLESPLTAHCPHLYDSSFLEFCHYPVLADHMGNTGLRILASSFSIYSTGAR